MILINKTDRQTNLETERQCTERKTEIQNERWIEREKICVPIYELLNTYRYLYVYNIYIIYM